MVQILGQANAETQSFQAQVSGAQGSPRSRL